MGWKETGAKVMGAKEMRVRETRARETRGKGDMLMGEREMDKRLPGDTTSVQNGTEGIHRKSYSEVVIEGVRRRVRVFVCGELDS